MYCQICIIIYILYIFLYFQFLELYFVILYQIRTDNTIILNESQIQKKITNKKLKIKIKTKIKWEIDKNQNNKFMQDNLRIQIEIL